jgi:RNA polymerase sigma-70 factor, ECF subfamily
MAESLANMHQWPDEELIATFQAGDEKAFDQLVKRYKDQLMNFVFRFLGDRDEADDVVQETFLRLFRHKHSYSPVAKFSTWLYTIATNLAKTQLRQRKRRALFSLSRRSSDAMDYEVRDSQPTADETTDQRLRQEVVQRALDRLPPKFREVVVLFDIQDMSYEEISQVTGINVGTVKSRLHRGRVRLKELLGKYFDV